MENQEQPLPANMPFVFHAKELCVMASFLVVLPGSVVLAIYVLQACIFHFKDNVPVRDQTSSDLFIVLMLIAIPISGMIAKYVWLLALSPFVNMADVSPWIAYGIPRRLHPLDCAFLKRVYRH